VRNVKENFKLFLFSLFFLSLSNYAFVRKVTIDIYNFHDQLKFKGS